MRGSRFLPPSVFHVAGGPRMKWCDFAAVTRKGSWLEVLALQGPISAAGAGVALEVFFQERDLASRPSSSPLIIHSFDER